MNLSQRLNEGMHPMRKTFLPLLLFSFAAAAAAHVSPNVTLIRRGDFLRAAFPEAARFFEKALEKPPAKELASDGWQPSQDETRIYVARNGGGRLIGTAVFLWIPSQHGPIAIGIAFDSEGTVREAAVTDIGAEPLAWVRPLLSRNRVEGLRGLRLDSPPDPGRIAPTGGGAMTRYYAKVIAEGTGRAQAIEKAALGEIR